MEFGVLGQVEVLEDGRALAAHGVKQLGVLVMLLLSNEQYVGVRTLAEGVWGDGDQLAQGEKAVPVHISRLRTRLRSCAHANGPTIRTGNGGYKLELGSARVDLFDFEDRVADAARAIERGRPEEAATKLRTALSGWRGPALGGLEGIPFAASAAARINEARSDALVWQLELELTGGHHRRLVGDLRALVATNPTDERLRGLLMLALYRSGRQAEALAVADEARVGLRETLGLEPSQQLRALERAIRAQDPVLDLDPEASFGLPGGVERPRQRAAQVPGPQDGEPGSAPDGAAREKSPKRKGTTGNPATTRPANDKKGRKRKGAAKEASAKASKPAKGKAGGKGNKRQPKRKRL